MVGVRDPPKVTAESQQGQPVLLGLLLLSQRAPSKCAPLSSQAQRPGLQAWEWVVRIKAEISVPHFITQALPPGSAQATFFVDPWKLCLMSLLIL